MTNVIRANFKEKTGFPGLDNRYLKSVNRSRKAIGLPECDKVKMCLCPPKNQPAIKNCAFFSPCKALKSLFLI